MALCGGKIVKTFGLLTFILALTLAGCDRDQPREKPGQQGRKEGLKTIVAVGDSLTAGLGVAEEQSYPAQLEKRLQADGYRYRVINAGVSSETSSGTLSRLDWVLTLAPDIVILETGANDGLRGIDPQVAENNIREILKILGERQVVVVLAGMKMVRNLGAVYVGRFNGIYPRLAEESGAVFMPFFLDGVAMQAGLNQADGIHPTATGYKKVIDNLYPYVLEAIKRREGK
jgi:acyl-CoA thioesterase-1